MFDLLSTLRAHNLYAVALSGLQEAVRRGASDETLDGFRDRLDAAFGVLAEAHGYRLVPVEFAEAYRAGLEALRQVGA